MQPTCNILPEDAVSRSTDAWTADSLSTTSDGGLPPAVRAPSFVVDDAAAPAVDGRRDFTVWRIAVRSAIMVSTCPVIDCRDSCAFVNVSFIRMFAIRRSPTVSPEIDSDYCRHATKCGSGGSAGRIWTVTICGSLEPICGSVITGRYTKV